MTPSVANSVSNHLLNTTATGGILTVISQNSSALTVIIVAITGIASILLNRRNTIANEKRNEINERDITDRIIKKLKKDGLHDEAHKITESLRE